MHQTPAPTEVHPLVGDRIHDLYATSSELRAGRSPRRVRPGGAAGPRPARTIGRRLISIGSAVAGQHA